MATRDRIHSEEFGGFNIVTYREDEDISPRGEFMAEDGSDDEEILAKIDSGEYDWFSVAMVAYKNGIQLATTYLGGCCYSTAEAFVTESGYYEDMRSEVVEMAKENIAKLTA